MSKSEAQRARELKEFQQYLAGEWVFSGYLIKRGGEHNHLRIFDEQGNPTIEFGDGSFTTVQSAEDAISQYQSNNKH